MVLGCNSKSSSYLDYCDENTFKVLCGLVNILTNENKLVCLPHDFALVRRRVFKFLTNCLIYNVNYKDLGHLNIPHFTNFHMYPLETVKGDIYPFFKSFFSNTIYINGGYTNHCVGAVVEKDEPPFINRRDFDLLVLYLLLTGKIKFSDKLCLSYLFKGGYNILSDLYKYIYFQLPKPNDIDPKNNWVLKDKYWFLEAKTKLNKGKLGFGLKYCEKDITFWTDKYISSISNFNSENLEIKYKSVEKYHILKFGGKYIINKGEYALIYNTSDSCPFAFLWDESGLKRFKCINEFIQLNSNNITCLELILD